MARDLAQLRIEIDQVDRELLAQREREPSRCGPAAGRNQVRSHPFQDDPALPDWPTAYRHLVADGRSATLTDASRANETRSFPPPVEAH